MMESENADSHSVAREPLSPRMSLGLEDASAYAVQQLLRQLSQTGFRLKVMVCGESGLGKTTLVDTLFRTTVNLNSKVDTAKINAKTVRIEKRECAISEGGVVLNLTVIDTPGYGDAINNEDAWLPVLDYILVELQSYFEREQDLHRKGDVVDTRVHACLYFLAPHRLKDVDIEFMKRLHKCVNLIPVIAKADTMTSAELAEYKQLIIDRLQQTGIRTYPELPFGPLAPQVSEDNPATPPFAVIGSNERIVLKEPGLPEMRLPAGAEVSGRSYPWGDACIEDSRHCDVAALRRTLVEKFVDLQRATQVLYEDFRSQELGHLVEVKRSASWQVMRFGFTILLTVMLVLGCFYHPIGFAYTVGAAVVLISTAAAAILIGMMVSPKFRDDLSMACPTAVTIARYLTCKLIHETRHDRRRSYMVLASAKSDRQLLWPLIMPMRHVIHRMQLWDSTMKRWKVFSEDAEGPAIMSPPLEPVVTFSPTESQRASFLRSGDMQALSSPVATDFSPMPPPAPPAYQPSGISMSADDVDALGRVTNSSSC